VSWCFLCCSLTVCLPKHFECLCRTSSQRHHHQQFTTFARIAFSQDCLFSSTARSHPDHVFAIHCPNCAAWLQVKLWMRLARRVGETEARIAELSIKQNRGSQATQSEAWGGKVLCFLPPRSLPMNACLHAPVCAFLTIKSGLASSHCIVCAGVDEAGSQGAAAFLFDANH